MSVTIPGVAEENLERHTQNRNNTHLFGHDHHDQQVAIDSLVSGCPRISGGLGFTQRVVSEKASRMFRGGTEHLSAAIKLRCPIRARRFETRGRAWRAAQSQPVKTLWAVVPFPRSQTRCDVDVRCRM